MADFRVRRARTTDVPTIAGLVAGYADQRILLHKERVTYYEDVQEFRVAADSADQVIGCGAVHVLWEDLAEVRTLAVAAAWRGTGVGHTLLDTLVEQATELGVSRLFCLTFEVKFFERHGFREIEGTPVAPEVYAEMLQSRDEGVAEFLDLARVKPNTLGNSRMLLEL
ncbi:amino-acid N-acetyltransferase [Kineosporia succinea]|uniref:Amino-acid N-acetyltransferase n=1 Tax=Kineosporia succinea TaxID=84632 RepID=A0ABT9P301_9ACTN|nr:amino-acid N-acetyltransferase [Kineosporia succinea]MDP9827061.1 amino-acid N-acetyltransferase [Kineosporia succinea]